MPIAIKDSKINITSEKSTKELAQKFTEYLKGGEFILLYGEMGVGKTTFVRHLINHFQKKENFELTEVTSPTFNLLNEYQVNKLLIKHYDLFRLKDKSEILNLDIFENYNDSITLIEWPNLIDIDKSIKIIDLKFVYENELNNRSVIINGID